jgi:hypothetical protein
MQFFSVTKTTEERMQRKLEAMLIYFIAFMTRYKKNFRKLFNKTFYGGNKYLLRRMPVLESLFATCTLVRLERRYTFKVWAPSWTNLSQQDETWAEFAAIR